MTVQNALNRLQSGYYNSEPVNDDTNPGGMGADGHRTNFPSALVDVGDVGAHTVDRAAVAEASAAAAAASEANAGTSETNAGASAAAAAQSEANAGASETSAGASAAAAAQSETNAGTSETNAGASAATAAESEANAAASETSAGASAAAAAQSETNAAASAQAAADTLAGKAESNFSNVDPATGRAALGLSAALIHKGDHDASGSDPASPSIGDVWRVSDAGTIGSEPVAQGAFVTWTGTEWRKIYSGSRAIFRVISSLGLVNWITIGSNAWVKVPLDTTTVDTAGFFDAGNQRFTPQRPGYYALSGNASVDGAGFTGLMLVKNGVFPDNSYLAVSGHFDNTTPISMGHNVKGAPTWFNGTGDYVELWAYSTANGGRVSAPWLAGFEL